MILFKKDYNSIILDLDGVIFDSNHIKAENIYKSVLKYASTQVAKKFTDFFTGLNGVPREEKIFNYFKDPTVAKNILESYNSFNAKSLIDVQYTTGFLPFLDRIKKSGTPAYVLSGADQTEITNLLKSKGIHDVFEKIMGGPLNKKTHLKDLALTKPSIYFGDSRTDYEAAEALGSDFVFIYQYSQFEGWKTFFEEFNVAAIIKNFKNVQYD